MGIQAARKMRGLRLSDAADWLVIAIVTSLPWSTSATSILIGLWLLIILPTLDRVTLLACIKSPPGGLPLLLVGLAMLGLLWSAAPLSEQARSLKSFAKLAAIPLLMMQFQQSERAGLVVRAFLGSCTCLLLASWVLALAPGLTWRGHFIVGVPVKDYISQSFLFMICIFVLADWALDAWLRRRWTRLVIFALYASAFLANLIYVVSSRTALVTLPVAVLAYCGRRIGWKGMIGACVAGAVLVPIAWVTSSYLQRRVHDIVYDLQQYESNNPLTNLGVRVEFWKKSIELIPAAPIVGHGTGSIRQLFRTTVEGKNGAPAIIPDNPHNQMLAVALQLGLLGVGALCAMWISHVLVFRGGGSLATFAFITVVVSVVGSFANSLLFNFTEGWTYVVAVGVVGGTVLRRAAPSSSAQGVPKDTTTRPTHIS